MNTKTIEIPDYSEGIAAMMSRMEEVLSKMESQNKELFAYQTGIYCYEREELARILKVDLSTLHYWKKKGKLIPRKVGGKVLYLHQDVMAMLDGHLDGPDGRNTEVEKMKKGFEDSLPKAQRDKLARSTALSTASA